MVSWSAKMEMPDDIHALVDRLGEAMVEALANDPRSRELAALLQEKGYEVALGIEATVALTLRGREGGEETTDEENLAFSEDDKAFLRKFKIRLE
jgi:hypothetical protein